MTSLWRHSHAQSENHFHQWIALVNVSKMKKVPKWYRRWFKSYGQNNFGAPHFCPSFLVFGTQRRNRNWYRQAPSGIATKPYSDHFQLGPTFFTCTTRLAPIWQHVVLFAPFWRHCNVGATPNHAQRPVSCCRYRDLQFAPCPIFFTRVAQKLWTKVDFWHFFALLDHLLAHVAWHREVVPPSKRWVPVRTNVGARFEPFRQSVPVVI